jgi:hypothetical protein
MAVSNEEAYQLIAGDGEQSESEKSFIGGYPKLPPHLDLPVCRLCGTQLTFFLQVSFPENSPWYGQTLAVFQCVDCYHQDRLIPELLSPLRGARIPEGFLDHSQLNFRFMVFDSGETVQRVDYTPRIRFCPLQLSPLRDAASHVDKLGGRPWWLLEDESPACYAGDIELTFLGQLTQRPMEDDRFELLPDAPGQMFEDYFGTQSIRRSDDRYYKLFIGNEIYLFGTVGLPTGLIYCVVQN